MCRKRKRNKKSAIAFEINFEENLLQLLNEVNSGRYRIGRTTVFVVTYPKAREIWAALFRDRIVHHLVYEEIAPFFEKRFIEDTYSCLKGRGVLAASDRLMQFHRKATGNYAKDTWFLQFDIKNFFVSIEKEILLDLLLQHVESGISRRLLEQIVWHDPTVNPIVNGKRSFFAKVPPHKSLWNAPKNRGLPIGNLTSQFFSNVYLNELDQFVKHTLRAQYYVRYVDDAVILHHDKATLQRWLEEVDAFLREKLKISLHRDKCFIKHASQGINFVGAIVKPYRRYARRSTISKAKTSAFAVSRHPTEQNIASVNSYLGLIRNTASYKMRKKICEHSKISTIVSHDSNYFKLIQL
jgi:hypothetical protein